MADNCQKCGRNLSLVGRVHNCVADTKGMANKCVMANSVANANAWSVAQPAEQRAVNPRVTGSSPVSPAKTYQYRDPEARRAYMKSYMQKRRKGAPTGTPV